MTNLSITLADGTRKFFSEAEVMGIKDGYLFISEIQPGKPMPGVSPEVQEAVFSDSRTIQPHIYAMTDVVALHTETGEDDDTDSDTDIQTQMIMEDVQQQMEALAAN